MSHIVIALPTGKSLEDRTAELFVQAGIELVRKHPRSCVATIANLPGVLGATYFKPAQIPLIVAKTETMIGITGMDMLRESGDLSQHVEVCAELSYNRKTEGTMRCVLFVKESDSAHSVEDIQNGTPIATEYPLETKAFLAGYGVNAELTNYAGSVEALVVHGSYRFGVALTETGETLRTNGLRELATVFVSSTVLIANKALLTDETTREQVMFIAKLLQGTLEARAKVLLLMNAPSDKLEAIMCLLPSLRSPTVTPLADPSFCSVSSIVPGDSASQIIFDLARLGAEGFVVLQPSTVM